MICKTELSKTIFSGEWFNGLRCHTKNQKDASSNAAKHLAGLW